MKSPKGVADHYRRGNLESARVILQNIAKHGGEDAALVEWARVVISREQARPDDREAGPLFGGNAG